VVSAIDRYRESRLRAFFDALATGELELTPSLMESDEFLHAYFSTLSAVQRALSADKVRTYARLLKGGVRREQLGDRYDELLAILADLSDRELCCLTRLRELETSHDAGLEEPSNPNERAAAIWPEFTRQIGVECGVDAVEVEAFMTRLMRTGTYRGSNAWVAGAMDAATPGRTTPTFSALVALLEAGQL
jgi:hypothetical protein